MGDSLGKIHGVTAQANIMRVGWDAGASFLSGGPWPRIPLEFIFDYQRDFGEESEGITRSHSFHPLNPK